MLLITAWEDSLFKKMQNSTTTAKSAKSIFDKLQVQTTDAFVEIILQFS